jgi:PTH1 family peptidyl-tRNA hydrolase
MKLIVGLGNPGAEYRDTRHNAGFMVIDELAKRMGLASEKPRDKFRSAMLEGTLASQRVVLLKPLTFMNRTGLAVSEAVNFYKLDLQDLLVVVDDLALDCGRIRLRPNGSAGGHNGLKDIEQMLATNEYHRLRVGIDARGRIPQTPYVLGKFTDEQLERLKYGLLGAGDAAECWAREGILTAMNRFNSKEG